MDSYIKFYNFNQNLKNIQVTMTPNYTTRDQNNWHLPK